MKKDYDSLSQAVERSIDKFFAMHAGSAPDSGLHDRVMHEIEKILIEKTLLYVNGTQVRAAKILGMNRNTLRRKIAELNIQTYIK